MAACSDRFESTSLSGASDQGIAGARPVLAERDFSLSKGIEHRLHDAPGLLGLAGADGWCVVPLEETGEHAVIRNHAPVVSSGFERGANGFLGKTADAKTDTPSNVTTTARDTPMGILTRSASSILAPTKTSTSARPILR